MSAPMDKAMHIKQRIIHILEDSAVLTFKRSRAFRFTISLAVIFFINIIRLPLLPWIGNPLPTLFVSPAIVLITWFGGLGPGLFAIALSYLSICLFWLSPKVGIDLNMDHDWLAMLLFAATSTFLAVFTEMTRNALALQKTTREHLENIVAERTAHLRETIAELESFSYTVSHDLRSPLRAMQGYASIVAEENKAALDVDSKGYLHKIAAAASRLDALIQDLLAYSKIGQEKIQLQPIDLNQFLPIVLEQYPSIQKSNANIILESPLLPLRAHAPFLAQAIANLLDNAVRFAKTGARPELRIWTAYTGSGQTVRLSIRDSGIGIPPDQFSKIFEVFQRVNRSDEGTGIGLSIVKRAIEKMGGRVGVESQLNMGSTFWIELPSAAA